MPDDFYCDEVLSGRTPVEVVLETDQVLAFHHTRPYWEVHIVLIPKQHVESLLALDEGNEVLALELLSALQQVAALITSEHGGCRIVTNLGKYQDSKHLHWHLGAGKRI